MANINHVEHVGHEQGQPIAADMKLLRIVGLGVRSQAKTSLDLVVWNALTTVKLC